jgi:hypothetical protein
MGLSPVASYARDDCPPGTVSVTYPPVLDEFGNQAFGYDTCSVDANAAMAFYADEVARIAQRIEQSKPKSGPDCVDLGVVFPGTSYEANYGVQCGSDVEMFTIMRGNHIAWVTEQINGTGAPAPAPEVTPVPDGCIEFGFRYKNTQYEVNFGVVCGPELIASARRAIVEYDAWVNSQSEPARIIEVILPTREQLLDPLKPKSSPVTSGETKKPGVTDEPKSPKNVVAPLFNPDGTAYGSKPVLRIPGSTDAAPFGFKQDGTPVPPPLFNPDGTPFILGTSPMPVPKPIIGAPFGYDSLGTPVSAPLWNPDGSPYVHGISELPEVPANLRKPIALTDPIAREIVNQELAAADISAKKKPKGYLLETEDQISYVDKSLKIVATKKGSKSKTLSLGVDANGDFFVPTKANLKGFQLKIKRGNKLIKSIKLG